METIDSPLHNPFPGLRPFRSDEHHLFFGREEQTTALLHLLRTNRFLAVVGTSGSGKSSLVRAGPALSSNNFLHAVPQGNTIAVMDNRPPLADNNWPLPDAAERKRHNTAQVNLAIQRQQWSAAEFHLRQLLRDDPENASVNQHLLRIPGLIAFAEARSLVQSGVGAYQSGQRADAIRDLKQARDRLRILHQTDSRDGSVASQLAISLGFLGSTLKDEHPEEALTSFKETRQVLESVRQPSPTDLYNLACTYANLSSLLDLDSPPPAVPERERETLAVQAIESLRRSIAVGMTNFALIERDHDLDPLRERPDFLSLILESTGRLREAVPHLEKVSVASPPPKLRQR